ncbi:MBL fold metallo-hydrolase [Natronomonas salina]|uniref:MBL fold metallo-hydrolase n=1 Tax=Natronomonas salina TaxID=1710540 RepID=UPI0015B47B34|nr:MBL fold metallo-hydrolase [Natronomonas salina]QLD90442.1 MBL fold metallo-hydrolase [Natronomonas salina]
MSTFEVTDGVHGIDVELFDEGFLSGYLFDDDEPTLVDPGAATSAETVLEAVESLGVDPAALENVVLSHVHLDHAGAAGDLVEAVPDLDVYVHEATAQHLVDPAALVESTRAAMGEHFAAMGEPTPVPDENIVPVPESGETVDIGANTLELIHAPGHSPDHFAVWNPERDLLFAAESIGGYLPRADRWAPPATLPNFDVGTLSDSIEQLRKLDPEHVVFPHFGAYPDPASAFGMASRELHRFDERIVALYEETGSVEATRSRVADELLDLSPPYDEVVETFYARLVTDGYLKYHDLL